MKGWLEKSR